MTHLPGVRDNFLGSQNNVPSAKGNRFFRSPWPPLWSSFSGLAFFPPAKGFICFLKTSFSLSHFSSPAAPVDLPTDISQPFQAFLLFATAVAAWNYPKNSDQGQKLMTVFNNQLGRGIFLLHRLLWSSNLWLKRTGRVCLRVFIGQSNNLCCNDTLWNQLMLIH